MKRTELKPTEAYCSPEIDVVSVQTETGFADSWQEARLSPPNNLPPKPHKKFFKNF